MPYLVSKYDPVSDDPGSGSRWFEVATVDRPMQLRPWIRALRAQSYSEVSIAIDQIDAPEPKPKGGK